MHEYLLFLDSLTREKLRELKYVDVYPTAHGAAEEDIGRDAFKRCMSALEAKVDELEPEARDLGSHMYEVCGDPARLTSLRPKFQALSPAGRIRAWSQASKELIHPLNAEKLAGAKNIHAAVTDLVLEVFGSTAYEDFRPRQRR